MGGYRSSNLEYPTSMVTGVFNSSHQHSLNNHPKAQEILNNIGNTSPTSSGLGLIAEYDSKNSFLNPTAIQNLRRGISYQRCDYATTLYQTFNLEGVELLGVKQGVELSIARTIQSLSTNERALSLNITCDIELRGIARNRYQGEHTTRQKFK